MISLIFDCWRKSEFKSLYLQIRKENMKKILIDVYKIKDPFSGLGQFSLNYAKEIIRQKNSGAEVDFLISDKKSLDLIVPLKSLPESTLPEGSDSISNAISGVHFVKANLQKRYLPFLNKKYSIWHSLQQFPSHYPGKHKAWILTIHDLNFLVEKPCDKSDSYLLRLQRNVDKADHITTISNYTRGLIESNLDLKGKEVRVIYNGIATNKVNALRKPGFVKENKFFFSIGIFNKKKNFHTLIPVMQHFKDHILVIAGNNNTAYGEEIRNEISRLGMGNRIILPGKISEEEKYWLYNNCEAFLFPSLAEGFGMPVIEAMKAGKPVFISDFTSLPEVGGEAAFYFRNFDHSDMAFKIKSGINAVHKDQEHFKKLFELNSQKFTWENCIKQYLELYREILSD